MHEIITSEGRAGAGIGLMVVAGIIAVVGGALAVAGAMGAGAWLLLPGAGVLLLAAVLARQALKVLGVVRRMEPGVIETASGGLLPLLRRPPGARPRRHRRRRAPDLPGISAEL